MKKLFEMWKAGWCVIARLWVFYIVIAIITLPFHLLPEHEGSVFDDKGFHPEALFMFVVFLLLIPLIFYCASRISKEFIIPRDVQKEWLEHLKKEK